MSGRKMAGRGQMTRGNNSGPAVMLMPPHIRATFMPPPPLKSIPPIKNRRRYPISGVMDYFDQFEKNGTKERVTQLTPKALKAQKIKDRESEHKQKLEPMIEEYKQGQRECEGKYQGMNCYNTLFIGRLAFEVTERKLLRELEAFGPVRDIKLVSDKEGKSKGYGFVEYENEEDMKRAYRAADGMRIEGREIVADVERGHTVPTWLPRRLGGGLGGTRLGGKDKNVMRPGRFDPSRLEISRPAETPMDGPPGGMGRDQGPPMYGGYDNRSAPYGGGFRDGPPPPSYGSYGGGPPRQDWRGDRGERGGSRDDGNRRRRRSRSRSPDRRYAPRPRY